jgi:5'-methylthioadenosine phosphorylase
LSYPIHDKANYVCIEGPRFSTRAESRFFRDFIRADIIGMTLVPECPLARESQICYASLSIITDYDVWANNPVSAKEILETLEKSTEKTKKVIAELIPAIPVERVKCNCANTLEGSLL